MTSRGRGDASMRPWEQKLDEGRPADREAQFRSGLVRGAQQERERIQFAIESIEGPEWAENDYWHGWIAHKQAVLRTLYPPEPMVGGPHEVEEQYRSEPSRDPRQERP